MAMASNSEAPTTDHIDAAIVYSLLEAECESLQLKPEQRRALRSILNGKDTIVVLPTGYGKSLVYLLLPFATQYLRRSRGVSADPQRSMVVVVEPLSSLVEDQVKRATAMNLRPTNLPYHRALYNSEFKAVGEGSISDGDKKLFDDICSGAFNIVFASPEALVYDTFWRKLLLDQRVRSCMSAIVVDEAHCILEW